MRNLILHFAVYLSDSNPSLWKAILTLRDHNSERRALNPDLWSKHEKPVASFVVNICKMAPNEDIVIKIMGILATNSAHLDLEQDEGYGQGCSLYVTFAKVNHSCYGKTKNVNQSQIHRYIYESIVSGSDWKKLFSTMKF